MRVRGLAELLCCALVVLCAPLAHAQAKVLPACELPPLSDGLQRMAPFFRFKVLPDCYPGKDDGSAPPIYGAYYLKDFLNQYDDKPTPALKKAIAQVAEAAVRRMSDYKGTLVFWYAPGTILRNPERHYSGLTQAYYLTMLFRASRVTGSQALEQASQKVLKSLMLPASEGGVFFANSQGVTIAEVPQSPNSWILNGWVSVLSELQDYVALSGDETARKVLAENVKTLAQRLPLYDLPGLRNSSYGLTGYAYFRVRFEHAAAVTSLGNFSLTVPGEGQVQWGPEGKSRWQSYVYARDLTEGGKLTGTYVRANLVISKVSFPAPNQLSFTAELNEPTTAILEVFSGRYAPTQADQVEEQWVALSRLDLSAGKKRYDVPIPWHDATLAAITPTNFVKKIGGDNVNVYHAIHIKKLRALAEHHAEPALRQYADKWSGYVCDWSELPLYRGLKIRPLDGMKVETTSLSPTEFCAQWRKQ